MDARGGGYGEGGETGLVGMQDAPVVHIVEDDPATGNAIQELLAAEGLQAQQHRSAEEFLDVFDPFQLCCVIVDVRLPRMNGVELQSRICTLNVHIPVILISGHADVPTVSRGFRAGAVDFLEKPFDTAALLERIRTSLESYQQKRATSAERDRARKRLKRLSPREHEVLELVVTGRPNKQIAAQLSVSERTVEKHRAHITQKLEVESLPELIRLVLKARS